MDEGNNKYDRLEQFFREKTEDYDIQYREEDWLKLEERLDKAADQRAKRRNKWIAAAAVAILFSILAYMTIQQQFTINKLNEQLNNQEQIVEQPQSSSENKETQSPENNQSDISDTNQETPAQNFEQEDPSQLAVDSDRDQPTEQSSQQVEEQAVQGTQLNEFMENRASLPIASAASPGFDGRFSSTSAIRPLNITSVPTQQQARQVDDQPSSVARPLAKASTENRSGRFSLTFQAGPDLSSANKFSNFSSPGHKLGLSVEYNITDKLALSVGAIRSKVQYTASAEIYNRLYDSPATSVTNGEAIGECILIDLPLSLKYDVIEFHSSRLYASGGLSSYFMLNEEYRMKTDSYTPGQSQQVWQQRTGNSHWASNATIAVGYEWRLNTKLNVRAEPFLKLPLQQVGQAKVNLYSLGSLISLNYRIK